MRAWWGSALNYSNLAYKTRSRQAYTLKHSRMEVLRVTMTDLPPLPEETYNQSLQVEAGRALIKYSSNTATAVRCSAVYHGVTQNEKWPKQTVLTSVPDSSRGS